MDSETNEELVERVQQGDGVALNLYIQHQKEHLLAVITKKMSEPLKAKVEPQDILQEVLMSAVSSFAKLDWKSRHPFTWLCQLADRRIVDAHRRYVLAEKRSSNREVSLNRPSGSSSDEPAGELVDLLVKSMTMPSAAFSRNQREIRMQAAINELPEITREAIRLRYIEGWSSKQIANELQKSDAAIRVLLTRSLKQLHAVLESDPYFRDFREK